MMLAGLAGLFPHPAAAGAADEDGAWQASTDAPLRQWTIAMYWAGDNDLDGLTDTFIQMWREHTTNTDDIALSVFIDRLDAPANISTFTEEGWVERVALGEVNSSSPDTLQSFIEYSMTEPTLEAENYMLILQDHGLGYLGICSDVGLPDSDIEKAWMSIDGLGKAVRGAIGSTGEGLDILTLDACTMSVVEVAYELRDTASYLVASELAVPFDGMNYRALLDGLSEDPYIEPVDLARKMVADYAEWYSAPLGTYPTLYPYLQDFATLSVIDLALIGDGGDAFAALSAELLPKDPTLGKIMKDASMDAFVTTWCNNMGCGFYSDIVTMFGAVAEEVRHEQRGEVLRREGERADPVERGHTDLPRRVRDHLGRGGAGSLLAADGLCHRDDRRGDHAEHGPEGEDGRGLHPWDAQVHEHRRHHGSGREDTGRGGARDHAGEHDQDHQGDEQKRRAVVKRRDNLPAEGVHHPGVLQHFHENHGAGDDDDRVQKPESAFHELAQGHALAAGERSGDRSENEGERYRQLRQEAPSHEHRHHDEKNQGLGEHLSTPRPHRRAADRPRRRACPRPGRS